MRCWHRGTTVRSPYETNVSARHVRREAERGYADCVSAAEKSAQTMCDVIQAVMKNCAALRFIAPSTTFL